MTVKIAHEMMWKTTVIMLGCLSCIRTSATAADPSEFLLPPPPGEQLHYQPAGITPPPTFVPEPTLTISPPFYQRVAQWFGIGGTEQPQPIEAISEFQQRHGEPSQLEPAVKPQKTKAACNPCNKVPWTPMISTAQRSLSSGNIEANSFNNGYPVYSSYRPLPPPRLEHQSHADFKQSPPKPIQDYRTKVQTYNSVQATKEDHSGYAAVQTQQQQLQHYPQRPQFYQPIFQHYPNYNYYKAPEQQQKVQVSLPTYIPKHNAPSQDYQAPQPQLPLQYPTKHHMLPIPVPNLSVVPLPPLFGYKPFRQTDSYGQVAPHQNPNYNIYQPPPAHLHEQTYVSPQPNPTPNQVPEEVIISARTPTTVHPIISSDVEIIPSISLAEFTSSVEYPVERHQSPVVDVQPKTPQIYSQPEYLAAPIVVDQYDHSGVADNYHSASSLNATAERPLFDRDGSIKTIQSQLTSVHHSLPITILPDLFAPETTESPVISSSRYYSSSSSSSTTQRTLLNVVNSISRDRGTPKDMLDSPIYYLNKSNQQQRTTKNPSNLQVSRLPDYDKTPWTPTHQQQGILRITSPIPQESTERPTRHSFVGPNQFHSNRPDDSQSDKTTTNKKPKQIQIIIPYTTKNRPAQFQPNPAPSRFQNFDTSAGWSVQSHHSDQHDSQESKVVTSTITQSPPPAKTTKYLTKILASNLKELLRKEKSNTTQPNSVDFSRLQKNIDVWTEQEFSTSKKASTISLSQSKSKIIPSEYLTTTPISERYTQTESADESTTTSEPLLADEAYSKIEEVDNELVPDPSDHTTDLWRKLMLSISPSTQEKVYVVTPQPWRNVPTVDYAQNAGSGFKSPRFLVRPTPGPQQGTSSAEVGFSFPEAVNRLQSSGHVQATTSRADVSFRPSTQDDEALDRHSKVFKVVTPPTFAKNTISPV